MTVAAGEWGSELFSKAINSVKFGRALRRPDRQNRSRLRRRLRWKQVQTDEHEEVDTPDSEPATHDRWPIALLPHHETTPHHAQRGTSVAASDLHNHHHHQTSSRLTRNDTQRLTDKRAYVGKAARRGLQNEIVAKQTDAPRQELRSAHHTRRTATHRCVHYSATTLFRLWRVVTSDATPQGG